MTMRRAAASALVLVGGISLLLALSGLAGGDLGMAPVGLIGLALLAAGLVLLPQARGPWLPACQPHLGQNAPYAHRGDRRPDREPTDRPGHHR
ncbi:hypothetical protein [Micromonospora sp. RTGN7]|uniref:hypothetical protein n=1 Tax=Micromonospora sp. RTGN7 TaxID=3016526 RepID=UPI0029FF189B|nr:hypothetical protein [Micromonospora sp. RTGN7]